MQNRPSEASNEENNFTVSSYSRKLYERLFWEEQKISLILKWDDIIRTLKNYKLSREEKIYLEFHNRQRNCRDTMEVFDMNKFNDNLEIDSLDLLYNEDKAIANMLAYFWPRIIHEEYWEAVLYWVWFNLYDTLYNPREFEIFEDYMSSNLNLTWGKAWYKLLIRSKRTMKYTHRNTVPMHALELFDLMKSLPQYIKELDLRKYSYMQDLSLDIDYPRNNHERGKSVVWTWREFDSEWRNISDIIEVLLEINSKDREKLTRFWQSINWKWKIFKIFHDSPIWILLKHKWMPIAMIGFSMKDESTVFINQMQQIAYEEYDRHGRNIWIKADEIAKQMDWQKMLYDIIYDFSKNKWYKRIIIQAWKNNAWVHKTRTQIDTERWRIIEAKTNIPQLSLQVAQKVYDVFALKNDFTIDAQGNWQKELF
ncbi:MAG: hypothetical protein ACD_3C00193G0001 [uncultured bacterium (gcode 4)]|uniref:Uncharacterized protein n=1 Tax=uncultured bacterium (gcode 4) TaxID=1234023 RepID=K2FX75_9BACT|nr:MAG: hypothetical protein ACD_3C00193G0001 [uncultured bacterium (gcode 4)]